VLFSEFLVLILVFLFFLHFLVVFAGLAGNGFQEMKVVGRGKTLSPRTYKQPPIAHPLTPWHCTRTPHPTHPPLAPPTPQHYTPTSHPHPPHGVPIFFVQLCAQHIPLRETSAWPNRCVAFRSVNPQPWRFTKNSLGLPHAHSLSICLFLWICVACVSCLLFLSFYLCFVRCVFCVIHFQNRLFQDPIYTSVSPLMYT